MLISDICSAGVGTILCQNALFAIFGFSPIQMNSTLVPLIMVHLPAGAATKQVLHFAQEVVSGKNKTVNDKSIVMGSK